MKLRNPSPLDYFEMRRAYSLPPHFDVVNIPLSPAPVRTFMDSESWIIDNLKGRFYIGHNVHLNDVNKLERVLTIGFEKPTEMSLFMIASPHLP